MTRSPQCTRRTVVASAMAASGTLLLAGCGGSAKESADGTVRLTFLTSYGNDPLKSGITDLIDEWNEQNPRIQVAHEAVQFADLLTTLNVRQTGGRGADIVSSYGLWGGQLAQNGVTATPPEEVARDITKNYSPAAVEAVTGSDGDLFGYPTEFNTYVLFYNKKLLRDAGFDAPPATWEELKEAAEATTARDSSGNYEVVGLSLIQDGDNETAHPFLSLLDAAGEEFLDAEGTCVLGEAARELMQLERDLAVSGATTTSIMPTKSFGSGGVAMAIQASWWTGSLKAELGEDYADVVGTAPLPGPEPGAKGSLAYSFFTAVNGEGDHAAEAWEFLTWLNTHTSENGVTGMGNFLANAGLIPPRKSDAETIGAELIAEDPNLEPIYQASDYAMAEPTTANAYLAKASLHNALNQILVNHTDVDETFTKLVAEINHL